MSDALDQSRGELNRQWDKHIGGLFGRAQYITNAVEALVNAILDARIAELERERDEWKREAENQTNWNSENVIHRRNADRAKEKAEAALAELRGRVEKARTLLASEYGPGRNFEALALLTDPEAKEGGGPDNDGRSDAHQPVDRGDIAQPARDPDPVPASLEMVFSALPSSIIDKFVRELNSWGDQCCGGAGGETNPVNGLPYGHVFYSAASALATASAAGITGKGTSDE